ncbi:MAG: HAMP domain-containing sensor histidine kinase [Myxococcota bacterium]|nr:HAMP domain-containing sensor histidine kinase [Myxococcota bacterium]
MSDILERTRAWFVDLPYEDVIERRRALLVQGGASIAIILTCIGVITGLLLDEGRDRVTGALLNLSLMATAIWAVVLVRRGNPTLGGAPFLAFVGLAIGWGGAFSLEDRGYSMFMGLVVMIAGISLPQRYVVLIIGAMLVNIAVLFQWNPAYLRVPDGYVINLVIMMFGAWLIAGLSSMLEQHTLRQLEVVSKSEKEALVARERAVAANATKSAFLANMSHELRTPLNAIIGYAELVQEENEDLDEPVHDDEVQRIERSARHLLRLINDLLDISKIEAGRIELLPSSVPLPSLCENLRATVEPLTQARQNRLVIDCPEDAGELVADQLRLTQILLNLLSNAAKFTDGGTVTLRVVANPEAVRFLIEDEGIGMDEETLERVFEPFTQASASTAAEHGGTGLGLPISKKLCEIMGGRLTAKSSPGKGSSFIVEFPRQPE